MDNNFLTPEQEAYLQGGDDQAELSRQLQRAKKLGVLAIDTTDPYFMKEALDAVESMQPRLDEEITKFKAQQRENGR